MTSYNIPEEIVGVPLFVPTAHSFMNIEAGGMPNGDDCLKLLGATNRDYKAFQPVQTVSPDLFRARNVGTAGVGWSMSFWFKGGNITGINGFTNSNQILFGVMNSAQTHTAAFWSTSDENFSNVMWAVTHWGGASSCGIGYFHPYGINGSGTIGSHTLNGGAALSPNAWHLIVINVLPYAVLGTSVNSRMYFDLDTTGTALSVLDDISSMSATSATTNAYFCIGSYSDGTNMNGRDGDWFLGKLAFHDHILNSTERAFLYDEMTT